MDIEFRDLLEPDEPTPEDAYRRFAASDVPFEAAYGQMILALLDALRRGPVGPRLIAAKGLMWEESPELVLEYSDGYGRSASISAKVDYHDRSPLVGGLPLLHYRLRRDLSRCGQSFDPDDELRTRDVATACEFVVQTIRKCRAMS